MSSLSTNTQAILLLTAPLLLDRPSNGEAPLTIKEYNRLAQELRALQHEPADLLGPGAKQITRSCRHIVDEHRLDRLLERGFLLSHSLERWNSRAIWVLSRADAAYPKRLKARLKELAPPIIYGCGESAELSRGGLAVVGSRNVGDAVVTYAASVGRLAAQAEQPIISGGARGVDEAAMQGALRADGRAVGIHAEGLEKAVANRENRNAIRDGRLILMSPYDPAAGFNVGNAMQRNKLIYALADAALVVNSDVDKGGTWAGATEQLDKLHFVPIYVRSSGEPNDGLRALEAKGAKAWPNPQDAKALQEILDVSHELELPRQSELLLAPTERPSATESAPEESANLVSLHSETKAAIANLGRLLRALPDDSFEGFLDDALIAPLLESLQDPQERTNHRSLGDFFTARKHRLAFLERLRLALHRTYAFGATTKDGKELFLSVSAQQWFEDGVMHTEGDQPHEGIMLLLQRRRIKVATIVRNAQNGEELGPNDFNFIDIEEANARHDAIATTALSHIDQPLRDLQELLEHRDNNESRYRDLFERYPWILGAEYVAAFREPLDEQNEPDFLARRSRDGRHDIIEIVPPFTEMNRRDGSPNARCHEAIAQSERFLDFARTNVHYLEQRRLRFDAPKCWLIAGYNVTDAVQDEFRRRQRLNPALHILTYNDLLVYVSHTVELLKHLRDGALENQDRLPALH